MQATAMQLDFERVGNRRLAGSRETGEPQHLARVAIERLASLTIDTE